MIFGVVFLLALFAFCFTVLGICLFYCCVWLFVSCMLGFGVYFLFGYIWFICWCCCLLVCGGCLDFAFVLGGLCYLLFAGVSSCVCLADFFVCLCFGLVVCWLCWFCCGVFGLFCLCFCVCLVVLCFVGLVSLVFCVFGLVVVDFGLACVVVGFTLHCVCVAVVYWFLVCLFGLGAWVCWITFVG